MRSAVQSDLPLLVSVAVSWLVTVALGLAVAWWAIGTLDSQPDAWPVRAWLAAAAGRWSRLTARWRR